MLDDISEPEGSMAWPGTYTPVEILPTGKYGLLTFWDNGSTPRSSKPFWKCWMPNFIYLPRTAVCLTHSQSWAGGHTSEQMKPQSR